jgi:phospholipase C
VKFAAKSLLLVSVAAAFAHAQTIPPNAFSHIIIIIQENRTPDNMFGSGPSGTKCGTEDPFEPGVDIENGGYVYIPVTMGGPYDKLICNISLPMNDAPLDPHHFYEDWFTDYRSGNMDGFCHEYTPPSHCPSYSYVQRSDVAPYFQIATAYGFANYMFQTNEGPSFPAHQFLFTGTSAPVAPNDPPLNYYLDFVADNADFAASGCPYAGSSARWVTPDPSGSTEADPTKNECYTHDSLVTAASDCGSGNCDRGFSWAYYTPTPGIIWNAPAGIPEVCYGENDLLKLGQPCLATEYTNHIKLPNQGGYDGAPILDDISNCKLQKITWVIPDQAWSDHPQFDGTVSPPLGPSWVGDIVDAIGNSYQNSLGNCDYWGYPGHSGTTPEPTAIFVVWDDWGGFFDHVTPPAVYTGTNVPPACPAPPAPNNWGCGYV